MKVGEKLHAKLDLHCFLIKNNYYEISHVGVSLIFIKTEVTGENINFTTDIEYSQKSPSDIIDIRMYIWDYFHKPIKDIRKLKLMKLKKLND